MNTKNSIACVIAMLVCSVALSQNVERITLKGSELNEFYEKEQYKYPQFISSRIYLNNGDTAIGRLNYNFFDQTIRYLNEKGDTVVIANAKDVSYITVASDTFFYDNGFYEWGATSGKARLAVRHVYKLVERKKIGAFGTSSPAKNIQTIDRILGPTTYDLQQNEEVVIAKETSYYISPIRGLKNEFVAFSRKNLRDLFPNKDVDGYIQDNRPNLNKEEDVLDLFIFLSRK